MDSVSSCEYASDDMVLEKILARKANFTLGQGPYVVLSIKCSAISNLTKGWTGEIKMTTKHAAY